MSQLEEGEGGPTEQAQRNSPPGRPRNYPRPLLIKSSSSSSKAHTWQSFGIRCPRRITEHLGAARDLFPSLSPRKSRCYTLCSYLIILARGASAHLAGGIGWELRCSVGQHSLWVCSPYILQKGWSQACHLLAMYPHTRAYMYIQLSVCICQYPLFPWLYLNTVRQNLYPGL